MTAIPSTSSSSNFLRPVTPKTPEPAAPIAPAKEIIPSQTERLRQAVSGAVDRLNLGLLKGLAGESKNPVLMGALTAVQLAQLMPVMTAEQQKVTLTKLGLPTLTADQYREGVKAYVAKLTAGLPKDAKLTTGTFTYVQQGKELNPKLDAGAVKALDFRRAEESAKTINKDIAGATNDMIKDLLTADAVQDAKVVLAAAAYVEAPWGGGVRFKADDTQQREFKVDGARSPAHVEIMESNTTAQRVLKGEGFEALYLPNGTSGDLGTVYIKPKDGQSVDEFIAKRGERGLREILDAVAKVKPTTGAVRIPKTKFDFKPDAEAFLNVLKSLGVPERAALLKTDVLELGGAVYQGKAETSEAGIKMAAAQALIFLESAMMPVAKPIAFDGNRSMLQVVMKGDQIVFFNPVVDPTKQAA